MKNNKINIPQSSFTYFQLTYPKVIETLRLGAVEVNTQITALSKVKFSPDEIAELFEHAVLMATVLKNNHFITQEQLESIEEISQAFDTFDKKEWNINSIKESQKWEYIRTLSRNALRLFSLNYTSPNLFWMTDII